MNECKRNYNRIPAPCLPLTVNRWRLRERQVNAVTHDSRPLVRVYTHIGLCDGSGCDRKEKPKSDDFRQLSIVQMSPWTVKLNPRSGKFERNKAHKEIFKKGGKKRKKYINCRQATPWKMSGRGFASQISAQFYGLQLGIAIEREWMKSVDCDSAKSGRKSDDDCLLCW